MSSHLNHAACPLCQGTLARTARKPIDRLLDGLRGLFTRRRPLYRYQCWAAGCGWQGRLARRAKGRNLYGAAGSRRHVLDAAR